MEVRRRWHLGLIAVALAGTIGIFGQMATAGTTGGLQGHVIDNKGNAVADVEVSVAAPLATSKTVTDAKGFYAFTGLPADTYTVSFSKQGYEPQQVTGITVIQDQTYPLSVTMRELKVLGKITVRGATSLIQPAQPADVYTVNSSNISTIAGVPQTTDEASILTALPGFSTDSGGFISIRGGEVNETGWQLEGIDVNDVAFTEPANGGYGSAPLLNGVANLSIATGGYDVSNGNTNAGVVNQTIKRGAYPGSGLATASVGWPPYNHGLSFEWGSGTPDNRLSYYFSFNGNRVWRTYGNGHPPYTAYIDENEKNHSIDDVTGNFFYRWGPNNNNELQYFVDNGVVHNVYQWPDPNPNIDPYSTANPYWQLIGFFFTDLGAFTSTPPATNFMQLYPGQVGYQQNIGYFDNTIQDHMISKINYKHQFSASSFGEVNFFRYNVNQYFEFPWNSGTGQDYGYRRERQFGISSDFTKQLSDRHQVKIGGTISSTVPIAADNYWQYSLFAFPWEYSGCIFGVGGCYVGPMNAAYNTLFPSLDLPTGPPNAPMKNIGNAFGASFNTVHRANTYISDRWSPNSRLTVTYGLRYDSNDINLPKDAPRLDEAAYINSLGNVVLIPGPELGPDIERPSQISPRMALSYEVGPHDVARFSYGKTIDFPNDSYIMDNTHTTIFPNLGGISYAWQNCTIANGCFHPLPGYSPTCTSRGIDPANGNAQCNNISNLFMSAMVDENTHWGLQYNPVRPQHAYSVDASWEHDFGHGLEAKVTPYYRKGSNYVIGYAKLIAVLTGNFPVYGPYVYLNEGINKTTGFEFDVQKQSTYGLSGFFDVSYNNTLQNYLGDFFNYTSDAAIKLNHYYHNYQLPTLTGHLNLALNTKNGFHIIANVPYTYGYYYGVGKKTFTYVNVNGVLKPMQVLNTDLVSGPSAYYFTDPANPGTVLKPNIIGSLGTPEGDDAGTLLGPTLARLNLTISHDLGRDNNIQVGLTGTNLFGNYNPGGLQSAYGYGNYSYQSNGFGGYGPQSGFNFFTQIGLPYQWNYPPEAYPVQQVGPPRLYSFYVSVKY